MWGLVERAGPAAARSTKPAQDRPRAAALRAAAATPAALRRWVEGIGDEGGSRCLGFGSGGRTPMLKPKCGGGGGGWVGGLGLLGATRGAAGGGAGAVRSSAAGAFVNNAGVARHKF